MCVQRSAGRPRPAFGGFPDVLRSPRFQSSRPSNRWGGRLGAEGDNDEIEFTVDNGQLTITGVSVNQLVSGGERGIAYKVEDTVQETGRITGKLGMSFFHSKYDVFTNTITFINCSGSQSFEAVPAP